MPSYHCKGRQNPKGVSLQPEPFLGGLSGSPQKSVLIPAGKLLLWSHREKVLCSFPYSSQQDTDDIASSCAPTVSGIPILDRFLYIKQVLIRFLWNHLSLGQKVTIIYCLIVPRLEDVPTPLQMIWPKQLGLYFGNVHFG